MLFSWGLPRRPFGAILILTAAVAIYAVTAYSEGDLVVRHVSNQTITPLGPVVFRANQSVEWASLQIVPEIHGETHLDGSTITFNPAEPMRPGATYRFDVSLRAGDQWLHGVRFDVSVGLADTLWVYVKLDARTHWIYVYHGDELVRSILASGGRPGDETPLGTFRIQNRGHHFWSAKYGEGAYYWVRIFGNYLFHSIPVDIEGNVIREEARLLGCPASHGCLRMSMRDAKWFYENVPDGTLVVIDGK